MRDYFMTIGKFMAVALCFFILFAMVTSVSKVGHAGSYTGQSAESVYSDECLAAMDANGLDVLLECVTEIYKDE